MREMLGMKQDALVIELGDDWNQKKISLLEQKETIEPQILEEAAKALKVPVEAIESILRITNKTCFKSIREHD